MTLLHDQNNSNDPFCTCGRKGLFFDNPLRVLLFALKATAQKDACPKKKQQTNTATTTTANAVRNGRRTLSSYAFRFTCAGLWLRAFGLLQD